LARVWQRLRVFTHPYHDRGDKVNTRTSNPRNALESLLHRLAVSCARLARDQREIGPGSGAPSFRRLIFASLAATLTALAFSAAPALAAEASCAGLPEPERAHEEQLRVENNSTQLPDCRVYELVSPVGKEGGIGDVLNREYVGQYLNPMQASPDGEAITYNGEAFSQSHAGTVNQYVSTRTASGWDTLNVSPPLQVGGGRPEIVGASPTLSRFVVATARGGQLSLEAPEGYRNIYISEISGSGVTATVPLITSVPAGRSSTTFGEAEDGTPAPIVFAPASEDFSRVYFAANAQLTEGAPAGGEAENNLYRWTAGKLHLVNVLPNGTPEAGATLGFLYKQIADHGHIVPDLEHVVSANGLRAFWTDEHNHNLYLRETYFENGERERTILIGEGADLLAANTEGTKILFTDESKLTGDSTAVAGQPDLYECELVGEAGHTTCSLRDLTVDHNESEHANVQGLVAISENGEYVYYVADGALASRASPGTCVVGLVEAAATCNLYLDHNGVSTFVATLSGADNSPAGSYEGGAELNGVRVADWTPEVWARQAEASPNGQFLAFGSHRDLTGQVNQGAEIFVYNAASGALSCASCSPDGESNEGAALPPFGDSYGLYEPRYMLNDGRLFFTTAAALVPQDVNNQKDVYEWDDGEVNLLSGGTSPSASVFAEASEEGRDVFFTTSQALVPEDQDAIVDMYDAREGGGFPAPSVARCGSSAECQGGAPSLPAFGAPASVTLSGAGNLVSPSGPSVLIPKPKPQTRREKLAQALAACRREHRRSRVLRVSCEHRARARYGAKTGKDASKKGRK
jgi:hypothetical protein